MTRLALALSPHVFVRPGELRQAEWGEIDVEAKVWRIPAARMKKRREHVVPLSRQALAVLEELRALTGEGRLIFRRWVNGTDRFPKTLPRRRSAAWGLARAK